MADVNDVLAANRAAVIDLVAAAERSAATWTTPRAPGKWSPSQVVEHVARGLEEAANVVSGAPSIPMPPAFLRPLVRLYFNRILKKGVFPKGWRPTRRLTLLADRPRRLRRASAWKGRSPGSTRNVGDGSPVANTS